MLEAITFLIFSDRTRGKVRVSSKVNRLPSPGIICAKFHDNPSNGCWYISVRTKVLDKLTQMVSKIHKSNSGHSSKVLGTQSY